VLVLKVIYPIVARLVRHLLARIRALVELELFFELSTTSPNKIIPTIAATIQIHCFRKMFRLREFLRPKEFSERLPAFNEIATTKIVFPNLT